MLSVAGAVVMGQWLTHCQSTIVDRRSISIRRSQTLLHSGLLSLLNPGRRLLSPLYRDVTASRRYHFGGFGLRCQRAISLRRRRLRIFFRRRIIPDAVVPNHDNWIAVTQLRLMRMFEVRILGISARKVILRHDDDVVVAPDDARVRASAGEIIFSGEYIGRRRWMVCERTLISMRVKRKRRPFRARDWRPMRRTISSVEMKLMRMRLNLFDRRWLRRMSDFLAGVFVLGPVFHYDFVPGVSLTSLFD